MDLAEQSVWELMSHGGGAMWVVVAFSVIALAVAIERAVAQWKFVARARFLGERVTRCLQRGALDEGRSACEKSPSPVACSSITLAASPPSSSRCEAQAGCTLKTRPRMRTPS